MSKHCGRMAMFFSGFQCILLRLGEANRHFRHSARYSTTMVTVRSHRWHAHYLHSERLHPGMICSLGLVASWNRNFGVTNL